MAEVVSSIRRVTDIMGEISAASNEQSMGVQQVGEAVTQMDQATQQNAALVEEMAAAASSLKGQAHELVQAVAFFKVDGAGHSGHLPPSAVRSSLPPATPFKGTERRAAAPSGGPAKRRSTAAPKASPAPAAARAPVPTLTAQVQSKPAPAGGDEDWETF